LISNSQNLGISNYPHHYIQLPFLKKVILTPTKNKLKEDTYYIGPHTKKKKTQNIKNKKKKKKKKKIIQKSHKKTKTTTNKKKSIRFKNSYHHLPLSSKFPSG